MGRHRPRPSRPPRPITPNRSTPPIEHTALGMGVGPSSSWESQSSTSQPAALDESFILVHADEQEQERDHISALGRARDDDETSSTIGSSLGDSILDGILSDTSSVEPNSAGELELDDWEDADHSTDTAGGPPPTYTSVLGGSYIDADASTEQSPLDASLYLDSTSSSQVRLVLPDPGSSFVTSSDGTTPSGSLANLNRIPHVPVKPRQATNDAANRRTVTQKWLEASSKLWDYVPHAADAHSSIFGSSRHEDTLRDTTFDNIRTVNEATPYAILCSHDSLLDSPSIIEKGSTVRGVSQTTGRKQTYSPSVKLSPRATGRLPPSRSAIIKQETKNWSLRMSAVAIASILSIIAYRSLGISGSALIPLGPFTDTTQPTPAVLPGGRTSAMWGSGPAPEVSTTASVSFASQHFADLKVIKHALSTLSGEVQRPAAEQLMTTGRSANVIYAAPTPKGGKQQDPSSSFSLSIRNSHTALSVQSPCTEVAGAISWRDRIGRSSRSRVSNDSAPLPTSVTWYSQYAVGHYIQTTFATIPVFLRNKASTLGLIYAPAVAEFWRELDELLALARVIAETSSTFLEFVIKRTGRGLTVSRELLQSAGHCLQRSMPSPASFTNSTVAHANMLQARRGLDRLSHYVDDQSVAIIEMFDQQAEAARVKMLGSVKQARRGLDRLVEDVNTALGREGEANTKSGWVCGDPLPRRMPRGSRERRCGGCERGQKKQKKRYSCTQNASRQRTRTDKIWDVFHHGVMALV